MINTSFIQQILLSAYSKLALFLKTAHKSALLVPAF